ncbi:hypothetical protein ATE92_2070 [Ulvibacter sp. MAR_2010_11]|uniref:hypothetical protein n=1 Tax=Ulvibacter sp. MAR_2010_11 TaxID=1250229 RepID=UPI000CB3427E|nr:hypothetical protein [Ulvibacter sp. MAR_2010_11]PKA83901.1 hypothetical protein ATE92_2070 [Ulvibacter sp. MAR_2010_11]
MKSVLRISLVIVISLTSMSLTKSNPQANEFPPIQKFLDKFTKVTYGGDPMTISQEIAGNTFIYKTDWQGIQTEETYSEINWNRFELYTKIIDDEYVSCEFRFSKDINYNYIDDEFIEESKEVNSFTCFILLKDEEEFLEAIRDWKNTGH